MMRRTSRRTRTDTLFPYTTLVRSQARMLGVAGDGGIVERRRKLRQVGERLAEFAVPRFEQVVAGNADRRRGGVVCFAGDAAAGDDDRALGRRIGGDRKSTRLNSSHSCAARMPSSA